MTDQAVIAALAQLDVEFPSVPELEPTLARLQRRSPRQSIALVRLVTTVTALVLSAVLFVTPMRRAVADWLGIGAVRIVEVEELPPGLGETVEGLGSEVPLDDSHPVPAMLGVPDLVMERSDPGATTLIWLPSESLSTVGSSGLGAVLTQFDGDLDPVVEKSVGPDTTVVSVEVGDAGGWWIEGAAHGFAYLDADGRLISESLRLAGNTLLWERDGQSFRLESGLGMDDAVAVAESIP